MTKSTSPMTATKLRLILSLCLVAVLGIGVAGFTIISGKLNEFAADVSTVAGQASASQNNIAVLQQLERELAQNRPAFDKASNIVAESKSYQYQDQVINDITNYGNISRVGIKSFTFDGSLPAASSSPSPATTPSPAAAPAGLKSSTVTIALDQSVGFDNLLQFVRLIEQNLTKMQVAKLSLARADNGAVTGQSLTIEVYIK